jgi:hypothetical protein
MDAPDELRQAVALAVADACARAYVRPTDFEALDVADAVLAVPAIADALRAAERDAKVRDLWAAWNVNWRSDSDALLADGIAALYPETGK